MMGERAVRLSVADDHGREFFMLVPRPTGGRAWRDERDEMLQAIEAAIERGDEPGEVKVLPPGFTEEEWSAVEEYARQKGSK